MTLSIRWLVPITFVFLTGAQRGYARWGSKEWWEGERELPMPIPCIPSIFPCVVTYGFPLWTTPKMPCQFLATDPRLHYHESAYCFEYPKNPYLNQATQKKYLPKFSYPKSKISNPQKILPASLSLQIQSTLFVPFRNFFFNMAHNMRLNSARFPSLDSFTEIEVFLAP